MGIYFTRDGGLVAAGTGASGLTANDMLFRQ